MNCKQFKFRKMAEKKKKNKLQILAGKELSESEENLPCMVAGIEAFPLYI